MSDFDRFVRYLVETLEARSPESVHRPVAIDDLRRSVLPYRVHRNGLGLMSAEDYETLLLRLAAEEGGYARTFPPEAAERCRAEVANAIPDLALLDELAEATIAVEPGTIARIMAIEEDEAPPFVPETDPELPLLYEPDADPGPDEPAVAKADTKPASSDTKPASSDSKPASSERKPAATGTKPSEPRPPADPTSPGGPARPAQGLVAASPPPARASGATQPLPAPAPSQPPPVKLPVSPARTPAAAAAPSPVTRCRFCATALPTNRNVVFCPFCGQQLAVTRCPKCDTDVEPGWRHCIACGHPMGPSRSTS